MEFLNFSTMLSQTFKRFYYVVRVYTLAKLI